MHNIVSYRVVQWTTGNVGKSSVGAIAKNPNYELIGCYAWSKDKADRDVGELVGIEPLGIKATNDVDALLALEEPYRSTLALRFFEELTPTEIAVYVTRVRSAQSDWEALRPAGLAV